MKDFAIAATCVIIGLLATSVYVASVLDDHEQRLKALEAPSQDTLEYHIIPLYENPNLEEYAV